MKKHIQEHIEFNKQHGIYNNDHIQEEEPYNKGMKIPYLIIKRSKQKNKPPTRIY